MTPLKTHSSFGGLTQFWQRDSSQTQTPMRFATYLPPGEIKGAVVFLAGLTCTDENFVTKAGAQAWASRLNLALLAPDTSPRGLNLPGEHAAYDFGSGAGFYVDATTEGYRDHYRMFSYLHQELVPQFQAQFKIPPNKTSLMGHSMGGHGALVLGLKYPQSYRSISAFAPIAHPVECAWGQKAFTGYLGADRAAWAKYDATELIKAGQRHPYTILIDQGEDDEFLKNQLRPEDLEKACAEAKQPLELKYWPKYDHSYYFISSLCERHLNFHAKALE